jgi:hypothetical protein
MPLFDLPLNERLLHTNLGFIVHSHYVAERIRPQIGQRPLAVIPQIMSPATSAAPSRHTLRGWPVHWPPNSLLFWPAEDRSRRPAAWTEVLAAFKQLCARPAGLLPHHRRHGHGSQIYLAWWPSWV